jgi:hypothetical protein
MEVCVRLFCVCAACAQVEALRRTDHHPRSPTDCVKYQETENVAKVLKGL